MQGHSLTQLLGLASATALVTAVIVIYQLRKQDTQARRADIPWRQEALGQLEQDLMKQGKALKRIEKSLNKQEKFLKALDADEKALNKELKARNNKQNETPNEVENKEEDEWEKTSKERLKVLLISRGR